MRALNVGTKLRLTLSGYLVLFFFMDRFFVEIHNNVIIARLALPDSGLNKTSLLVEIFGVI